MIYIFALEVMTLLKVTKVSSIVLMFYILFYLQIWGDNHLVLYGSAVLTAVSMIVFCIQEGYFELSKVPYGVWNNLIIVIYSLITGLFVAYNYNTVVSSSITLAAYSVVCIAMCYVSSEEGSFEWVLRVLILLALLCAIYAFIRGEVWEGYGKTLSRINNPHIFAGVMNLGIFSATYLIKQEKEQGKSILYAALIILFLYSTIASGSRKYFIASSCLLLIWTFASVRERWNNEDVQNTILTVGLLLFIVFVVYYIYRYMYSGSLMQQRMINSNDMGNQHRIRNYRKALEIFIEHPFFGGGYDQFRYYSGAGGYAHSTYAEAIADFGLSGCIIYFTPIVITTHRILSNALFKKRDYHSWLLLAFCVSELFIGIGQIFFMSYHHFPAWMILYYYAQGVQEEVVSEGPKFNSKYTRA